MTIAVLTSIYGGYDVPAPPTPQDIDCEWLLVTDRQVDCWPWKPVVEPRPQLHPRLAAKVAKCRPDLYTDADVTIWVDGHLRITSPSFVSWAIRSLDYGQIAQLPHPHRRSVVEEARVSEQLPKYRGLPVAQQIINYLEQGYPDGWGLWATGLIVRHTVGATVVFGDAWLAEQVRWTYQDQLSEAPILWRHGLRPVDLDGPLLGHPMFDLAHHSDGSL